MKLLLTSAGITNESITRALRELVGKPTSQARIVVIPTAHNPEVGDKRWVIDEDLVGPARLGWKQLSIVDLAALSSLERDLWWPQLEAADVLLFGGGSNLYLSYWLQRTGFFALPPQWWESKVYVGISAGSIVAGSSMHYESELLEKTGELRDNDYDDLGPKGQSSNKTLNLVNFAFRPHLNSAQFPKVRTSLLEERAAEIKVPMYALDDQSALKIVDGKVEVISEGSWRLFDEVR